jgi:hypothetical protein
VKDIRVEQFLKSLEEEAVDEFDQLASVGGKYFSTADLLVLKGKWEERFKLFNRLHKLLMYVGGGSAVFLILAFLAALFQLHLLASTFLILSPLSFIGFIWGSFYLKKEFNSRGYLEYIGMSIDQELAKRKNKNTQIKGE